MKNRSYASLYLLGIAFGWCSSHLAAGAQTLVSPVACELGQNCFIQQFPDMAAGPTAVDSSCRGATYDTHTGTDFRVLSMKDVASGVAVRAVADGVVLRARDGMSDALVHSVQDRKAIEGRECGNGLVISHEGGVESQYCHLRQGSIRVKPGDKVTAGQPVADIGASGLAQFPHLHLSLRRDGTLIDPWTTREIGAGCAASGDQGRSLFPPELQAAARSAYRQILALGVAGRAVTYDELSLTGPPPTAAEGDDAIVGWVWIANLAADDTVRLRVTGENDEMIAAGNWRIDRHIASQLYFVGERGKARAGTYLLNVEIEGHSGRTATESRVSIAR